MVSVLVPYIKDRGYLNQCLGSILSQKGINFELIEVKNNASVAINFNIGLKRAKGTFFKVVGDDDWLPENALRNLVNGIKDHPWVVANAYNTDGRHRSEERPPLDKLNLKDMAQKNVIHNGTTLYRTHVLRDIGGMDESLWTGEEYEMHLRLMKNGFLPGYVDELVYFYREWSGQKSRQLRRQNKQKRDGELRRIQALYSNEV